MRYFHFGDCLDRHGFAWRAVALICAFIAVSLLFPLLLAVVIPLSGCQNVDGACGAVSLGAAIAAKHIVLLVYFGALLSICVQRARDMGLPPIFGTVIPLIGLGNWVALTVAGTFNSFVPSLSIWHPLFPAFFVFALLAQILFCFAPQNAMAEGVNPRLQSVFILLGCVAAVAGCLKLCATLIPLPLSIHYTIMVLLVSMPVVVAGFLVVGAYLSFEAQKAVQAKPRETAGPHTNAATLG